MTAARKRIWRTDAFFDADKKEIIFLSFTTAEDAMFGLLQLRQLGESYIMTEYVGSGKMDAHPALALMAKFEKDCLREGHAKINPMLEKNFIRLVRDGEVFHNAMPHQSHPAHAFDQQIKTMKKTVQNKPGLKINPR